MYAATKSILRDHCDETPPVFKDHAFLTQALHFNIIEPVLRDHILQPRGRSSMAGSPVQHTSYLDTIGDKFDP